MTVKKKLRALVATILEKADKDPEFAEKLAVALGAEAAERPGTREMKKRRGRRNPPQFDPVLVLKEGEELLRERLAALDIKRLRDIVAGYGMDPGKLVMKWKSQERVIDHIVEVARTRAKKGEAFR